MQAKDQSDLALRAGWYAVNYICCYVLYVLALQLNNKPYVVALQLNLKPYVLARQHVHIFAASLA